MYRRIRDMREDKDLLQKDLAEYLQCGQVCYSYYETGKRDIPHRCFDQTGRLLWDKRRLPFGPHRRKDALPCRPFHWSLSRASSLEYTIFWLEYSE